MVNKIDVTGLSPGDIGFLESLVELMRNQKNVLLSQNRNDEAWSQALQKWVDIHPKREINIEDRREVIYSERG